MQDNCPDEKLIKRLKIQPSYPISQHKARHRGRRPVKVRTTSRGSTRPGFDIQIISAIFQEEVITAGFEKISLISGGSYKPDARKKFVTHISDRRACYSPPCICRLKNKIAL
jgi:hypothetical protein